MADSRIALRIINIRIVCFMPYCCCIYYRFVCFACAKKDGSIYPFLLWPIIRNAVARLFWTCSANTVTHATAALSPIFGVFIFLPPLNGRRVFLTNMQHTEPHNKAQSPLPPQHHHHPFLLPRLSLYTAYPKTLKHCVLWYLLLGLNWKNNIQQPPPTSFYKGAQLTTQIYYIFTRV